VAAIIVMMVMMVVVVMMMVMMIAIVVMMVMMGVFHRHGFAAGHGLGRNGEGREGKRGSQDGRGKNRLQHWGSFRESLLPARECRGRSVCNLFIPASMPVFP
jgi:hypothetical protein